MVVFDYRGSCWGQLTVDSVEIERLLALTSNIYDAALDASLWPSVLQQVCVFVGGASANLFSQDIESKRTVLAFEWGNDPHYSQLYLEKYYKLNPVFPAGSFMETGKVHSTTDLIPMAEFRQTRFYQEWVQPQGISDAFAINLERTDTHSATFAVQILEQQGGATEDKRRRLALIAPHLRRAVAIGQVIDFHAERASTLKDAFEVLKSCVVLVDASARIVFVNGSGLAALDAGSVVQQVEGALTATDPKANQALLEAFALSAKGDGALGTNGLAVPLTGTDGEKWNANVLALTSGARRRSGISPRATAAVFIRRASLYTPSAMEHVAKRYKLTPGEIRVFHALIEVGGVPSTAEALGVSETTVKTHLKNLFEKTGVNRQADLVKLIASTGSFSN
jgi:DNA-binding CsgD family transcriptional regulator